MFQNLMLPPSTVQIIKYCCVGAFNTLVAVFFIFLLMWLGVSLYVANALGYIIGMAMSYWLNSKITFAQPLSGFRLLKFIAGVAASYAINVAVIYLALLFSPGTQYLSQALGIAAYTISGFFINKFWALK